MDFTRQGSPAHQIRPTSPQGADSPAAKSEKSKRTNQFSLNKWSRLGAIVLLFATTILVAAMAFLIYFNNGAESKLVDTKQYQAVFINDGSSNGQAVYFGHITSLTDKYIVLRNVYYITASGGSSSSSSSNNSYSLTKLGCQQLHDPTDQMVINRDQVAFWENLNDSGKVVQTIQQFVKQNPNGPNCSATTSGTSDTTTQNASGGNGTGNTQNSASSSSTGTSSGTTSGTTGSSTKKP